MLFTQEQKGESLVPPKKKIDIKTAKCVIIVNSIEVTKHNENLWKRKIGVDNAEHYCTATNATATQESRLRQMYFKILHNIYHTNILLYK